MEQTFNFDGHDIIKILQIALKLFAEGFSLRKGAIFVFGPNAGKKTGTVMKISKASKEYLVKVDQYVDERSSERKKMLELSITH